ncbi:MAG: protein-glutamate O-methyltransferase CheR [Desulfobacteraceae bacterium]|jgi:chemotaxis protein methyltransferase CheR|nr:protein-glutamate O-methyltransferase CheR [Desulfobacteraceae bacterium]MDH3572856.1 protein-glutamate O-methyltransferase CheR [Desulfobacteraceae bacterium]MDH3721495.1 protein-glutamate O-methyltransferase CheR [Desulfobacteraceae bacterium]MDH3836149.1 protein-glutamate O-methyltransferase CheR [Desulfobacteraceae bacterium]MDH3873718.1 protein-glutamate O-methyltransferase CheR [Desulfobacteraceae bacterium]
MIKVATDDIKAISKYILDISGIDLNEGKAYLIETRLGGLIKEYECSSYRDLCSKAKTDSNKSIENKIIDAISTNETLFFRDSGPFEVLQHKILPDLIDRRTEKSSGLLPIPIRIWSTACSTGQEVYSIAIVLKELLPDLNKYNIKLLGTDISDSAIKQASYGTYNKFEIERGLSKEKLQKYFIPNGGNWKISDELRAMVSFTKRNILESFMGLGKLDIIFCRNVAIYFDLEERKKLFENIASVLEPDGFLIIGSTESLTGICPIFEPKRYLKTIYYQLR